MIEPTPGYEPWMEGQRGTHGGLGREELTVPLLIAGPGVPHRELRCARTVDIFPTLCELLGLPRDGDIDGRSLMPAMQQYAIEPL